MKSLKLIGMIILIIFTICACQKNPTSEGDTEEPKNQEVEDKTNISEAVIDVDYFDDDTLIKDFISLTDS